MINVINIKQEHFDILPFLFPNYTVSQKLLNSHFIAYYDVKSKYERELLDINHTDAIIISSKIFDEFWDETLIKQKVIEFCRDRFKSRKTKLETSPETFVQDCINFIFDLSVEDDSQITSLFDSIGSSQFAKEFLLCSKYTPVPVLTSAVNTFVLRTLQP